MEMILGITIQDELCLLIATSVSGPQNPKQISGSFVKLFRNQPSEEGTMQCRHATAWAGRELQ
jgi:hypothetical protein